MNIRFWGIRGLVGLMFILVILRVGYGVFTSALSRPQLALSQSLIGYWSFDDTDMSGNVAYDRSGQGHNGTLMNGAHTAAGMIGQAIEFDGRTSYIDTASDFVSINAITIVAWVCARSNGESGHGRILDNGSTVLKVPNADRLAFSSDGQVT